MLKKANTEHNVGISSPTYIHDLCIPLSTADMVVHYYK